MEIISDPPPTKQTREGQKYSKMKSMELKDIITAKLEELSRNCHRVVRYEVPVPFTMGPVSMQVSISFLDDFCGKSINKGYSKRTLAKKMMDTLHYLSTVFWDESHGAVCHFAIYRNKGKFYDPSIFVYFNEMLMVKTIEEYRLEHIENLMRLREFDNEFLVMIEIMDSIQ
jgi:hypothetical protein